MKAEKMNRLRRQLIRAAVDENLAVIRGLPPRGRQRQSTPAAWLKRAPIVLVPLTLLGSTYLANKSGAPPAPARPAITRASVPLVPEVAKPGTGSSPALQRVAASALPLAVRRVVLDAGHGGRDPGATTDTTREKDITLDIGRRLSRLLERDGFEVIETRTGDESIPLRERARLANASRSDIFVSIHVNALLKYTANRGIETYYLGPTDDPRLTKLAAAENSGSGYSLADMRNLLDNIYAHARSDESQHLASAVQRRLWETLRNDDPALQDWGTKRAPFVVLVGTEMPAILAEVGCISNDYVATLLDRPAYRQKIAQALFEGIHAYASAADAPQKKGT